MCRPSCCRNDSDPGAGIAAVAILMFAAVMVAKIGPVVAHIIHTVLEVLRLAALTVGVAAAVTVVTWAVIKVTRWQLRRRTSLAVSQARVFVMPERGQTGPANQPRCLACGGTGTVLRALGSGHYRPGACPVCVPARRAG
jgi:hypothetical protein